MTSLVLTYRKGRSPVLTDGFMLRPDTLCRLSREALAATPLRIGRTVVALSDLFTIAAAPGEDTLHLLDTPALDRLGANMAGGFLIIEGDAGNDLGASMTGGLIRVTGNAGHRAGGPDVTSRRGMTGGEIVIHGNAGDHAGFLMRRGLIAIAGFAGKSPGYRMLAGTVIVSKGPLDHPGLEMQRGTIVCLDAGSSASTSTSTASTSSPERPRTPVGGSAVLIAASAMAAMLLVTRRLDQLRWLGTDAPITPRISAGSWRITHMDPFAQSKGEVLQWQA